MEMYTLQIQPPQKAVLVHSWNSLSWLDVPHFLLEERVVVKVDP